MTATDIAIGPKAIILVDDESDIVAIFKRALEFAGYTVLGFTEPDKALEHVKSNRETCGLIISDVRMPNINGIELAKRVHQINLAVPFVLMSAFDMANLEVPPELKIAAFLQKPAKAIELKNLVCRYLPLEEK